MKVMKNLISIIFLFSCFTLTCQELENKIALNDTFINMSDDQLKELEQKLESEDPTFRFKFLSENDVSFFLAAQKRRPQNFIWIDLIKMYFASERYNAKQLENKNEQQILYENALKYLTESLKIFENIKFTDSNDSIKRVYNYYLGILKEDIAFAALEAGELDLAKRTAKELLIENSDKLSFNYGNKIHDANTILGRVSLRKSDLQQAKVYLIKSIEVPASPQLSTFGPSYILAKELLELGEKEIVLSYLDMVFNIWANPENISPSDTRKIAGNKRKIDMLDKWKEEIKSGKIPQDPGWQ